MRVGIGYDIHRLVADRKTDFWVAFEIPYHLGLLGHSDADVLDTRNHRCYLRRQPHSVISAHIFQIQMLVMKVWTALFFYVILPQK